MKIYQILIGFFIWQASSERERVGGTSFDAPVEKGKPPTDVCWADFFKEANGLKTNMKIYDFLIGFLKCFFLTQASSARSAVDGTSFDAPVEKGKPSTGAWWAYFFLQAASKPKANMKTCESMNLWFFWIFFKDRPSLQGEGVGMGQSVSIYSGEGETSHLCKNMEKAEFCLATSREFWQQVKGPLCIPTADGMRPYEIFVRALLPERKLGEGRRFSF